MELMGTLINRRALFADETQDYRMPEEPDEGQRVRLRFRTAKDDVDGVFYIGRRGSGEKQGSEEERQGGEEEKQGSGVVRMKKVDSDPLFDYYGHTITVGQEPLFYCFRIDKGAESCYYSRLGEMDSLQEGFEFRITPGFHTPEWAKGAIMYQIFVDRFCREDRGNDVLTNEYIYVGRPVTRVEDWHQPLSTMDVGRFYGGDLKGVWQKLDYLQSLGIEVIYFNPLFVSPSNHKYDCQDYDHIDPHLGVIVKDGGALVDAAADDNLLATRYRIRSADKANLAASNAFFASFMEEAHRRGLRVIIDGVFNHCGSFNKWLDRERVYEATGAYEPGAYISEDSPYRTFFRFYNEAGWPYNDDYDGWWGHNTLPKLNYEESPKLYQYILEIAKKWVSPPYSVDGWRLDVAADLGHSSEYNHRFWRDFRTAVKSANPDALILAEHYGNPDSWLQGDQWDTVMNYDAFMEPLTWFLTGMEKHSDDYNGALYGDGEAFFRSMNYHMSRMQTPSLMVAMNQLSNHDHSRFLTRTNQTIGRLGTAGAEKAEHNVNYGVFREAVLVQMTWPGAPTVYYGDETGVCGWTDPDSRRTYPWGKENQELIEFHRYMIGLRGRLPALRRGSLKQLMADRQLIAYGRMKGNNKCVIVVNNRASERLVTVPVWELGIRDEDELVRVMLTTAKGYNVGKLSFQVRGGELKVEMLANSSILFTTETEKYF